MIPEVLIDTCNQITQLSPAILLAVVLYVVGFALKKAKFFPNALVPWVPALLGASIYPCMVDSASIEYHIKNPTIYNMLTGFALGALPTWGYEAAKAFMKPEDDDDGLT